MITNEFMAKIAINKSLLKEYASNQALRTVYLNDGDEFQIQLFNPNTEPIATSISINNEELSNRIIIRPGERIWLERYLDRAKKFKFETYEVEDNATAKKAIAHNGEVVIKFYEKSKRYNAYTYIDNYYINHPINTVWNTVCDTLTTSTTLCDTSNTMLKGTVSDSDIKLNTTACVNSINADNIVTSGNYSDTIETGRIGEGSHSNQKLENVYEEYESWAAKVETIKILPESRKPYTSYDLEKIYCSECGRKLKTKFKYCPYCGTKIDY